MQLDNGKIKFNLIVHPLIVNMVKFKNNFKKKKSERKLSDNGKKDNKLINNKKNQIKKNNNSFLKIIYNLADGIDINKLKNENFIDSHFETIKKVEDLINKMDKRKKTNKNKQGLFRKNNHSINKLDNRSYLKVKEDTFNFGAISDTPFQIGTSDNKYFEKNSNMLNNTISEINVIQDEKINNQNPIENSPPLETTHELEYPVLTEIELEKNEKTTINSKQKKEKQWIKSGIPGFDELLEKGIPKSSNIIISGGPGSGKTIFCLQTLYTKALEGKDCVFLSMEERPERLKNHMLEFGFKLKEIERNDEQIILRAGGKGRISLRRLQPIILARSIEALLEKASGSLPIEIDLVLDFIPENFKTCLLTLDSISAIETAFSGTKRQYRIYIEQLFRYFENMDITTFMITESSDAPNKFSTTGVEEFLADGIFVFYNLQGKKGRTRGVEIYKLRGASHSQSIAKFNITNHGLKILSDKICM